MSEEYNPDQLELSLYEGMHWQKIPKAEIYYQMNLPREEEDEQCRIFRECLDRTLPTGKDLNFIVD